jgi:hypothetical protein
MRGLLRKVKRRLAEEEEYLVRLDLARKPAKRLPLEFKRDRIMKTYTTTFRAKREEILRILGALRGVKIVKCTIRNPENTCYLCLLADGRVIIDSEHSGC